jgi:hypothetical protein
MITFVSLGRIRCDRDAVDPGDRKTRRYGAGSPRFFFFTRK